MSLVVNNESDARNLMRQGYRSYDNPDGRIETIGRYDSFQGAREGARQLARAEKGKQFSIVQINTRLGKQRGREFDVVYREKKQEQANKKLKEKKYTKEELEEIKENKLRHKILRF